MNLFSLVDWFFFLNVFHALHASLLTFLSSLAVGGSLSISQAFLSFCLIFALYNRDRAKVNAGDMAVYPERSKFVLKHVSIFKRLTYASLLCAVLTGLLFLDWLTFFRVFLSTVAGWLYLKWKKLPAAKVTPATLSVFL